MEERRLGNHTHHKRPARVSRESEGGLSIRGLDKRRGIAPQQQFHSFLVCLINREGERLLTANLKE